MGFRTLVSHGAIDFVRAHAADVATVPPGSMVSITAEQTWKKWKDRLEGVSAEAIASDVPATELERDSFLQDTVGAVAWHQHGGLAAGVSRWVGYSSRPLGDEW